jgi:hypothetical protein
LSSRESEGSFQYGNYYREVEDLRAIVQHFREKKYEITAIVGHSKGQITVMHLCLLFETEFCNRPNRQLIRDTSLSAWVSNRGKAMSCSISISR